MPIAVVFLSLIVMKKIKIETTFDVYDRIEDLAIPNKYAAPCPSE